jgi:hypothetical protein
VGTLALLLVAVFLVVMLRPAFEYAYEESYVTSPALELPVTYRAAALPFGMLLMAILAIAQAVRESMPRRLIGSIATVAAIVGPASRISRSGCRSARSGPRSTSPRSIPLQTGVVDGQENPPLAILSNSSSGKCRNTSR